MVMEVLDMRLSPWTQSGIRTTSLWNNNESKVNTKNKNKIIRKVVERENEKVIENKFYFLFIYLLICY